MTTMTTTDCRDVPVHRRPHACMRPTPNRSPHPKNQLLIDAFELHLKYYDRAMPLRVMNKVEELGQTQKRSDAYLRVIAVRIPRGLL